MRALSTALVLLIVVAAPAHASDRMVGPYDHGSLTATFEAVASAAQEMQVEKLEPASWFPVRGVIDFGEGDARFGATRGGHMHEGQDVFAKAGTPVVSVREGTVVEKGDDGGRGNYVAIWSPAADRTYLYLHMRRPSPLREGERVAAGTRIGAVGCTGACWGDHLHVEMRRGRGAAGKPLDPLPLLRRLARRAR